eukprot:TRINITY_DN3783_c0_g1_i2.p1 TRINITY_DN3783_c0_g1~~TRINITY_DN3783_c0_g1_i2.p1  ORF type:complete len:101 (+),score=31.87 TRINITY_DN3783_c0_g1_i2:105-407(+)
MCIRDRNMAKTAVVSVARTVKHSKYPRFMRRSTKHLVHDEAEVLVAGDKVKIQRSRPLSKRKHYVVSDKVVKIDDVEIFKSLDELYPDLVTKPPQIVPRV